jgi:hypothetical protein
MVMNFYTTSRANDTVSEVQRLILEGRQIVNIRGNVTLGAVGEAIAATQEVEREIRDNLTQHRIVTNQTRDLVLDYIGGFNETNEQERVKAVDTIIQAVNNNTVLLQQIQSQLQNTGSFDTSSGMIASQPDCKQLGNSHNCRLN